MQPYIFPYIGYIQLMWNSDLFVVLDDVVFVKNGWVNKNRLVISGQDHKFSIPVKYKHGSPINEIELAENFEEWQKKFIRSVKENYASAPHFNSVFPLLEKSLTLESTKIIDLALFSMTSVMEYLGKELNLRFSSDSPEFKELRAQDKIIAICQKYGTDVYINLPGGRDLYSQEAFASKEMKLCFIEPIRLEYAQKSKVFHEWMSIIDVLMYVNRDSLIHALNKACI